MGMVRTALFNWAFARHTGGTFVFRIEDTDTVRDSEESYQALVDALQWLGLDWDEGPLKGGAYGPYRQSERLEIYADVAERLLASGHAYRCYCTADELEERRVAARKAGRAPGYEGTCRDLSEEERAAYAAQGRESVVRFRMPGSDIDWEDLIRGDIHFGAEHIPDFVLVRANGDPLYTLVNPVDDALMRITHVLRGEDLLSSTPRQIALHHALAEIGVGSGVLPKFGHLPYVMGEGNKKLSKRDPESSLQMYRDTGYLPEALLNYLALLGWSMGDDREFFTLDEMADAFTLPRVNPNPARFDLKKCTAINGDWIRSLDPESFLERSLPFLGNHVSDPPTDGQIAILRAALPLVQERVTVLTEVPPMVNFLFEETVTPIESVADPTSQEVLRAAQRALESLSHWSAEAIEGALRAALIDELGLKPKHAFGPIRIAITGSRVSPPLFESMEILGRQKALQRVDQAITAVP